MRIHCEHGGRPWAYPRLRAPDRSFSAVNRLFMKLDVFEGRMRHKMIARAPDIIICARYKMKLPAEIETDDGGLQAQRTKYAQDRAGA